MRTRMDPVDSLQLAIGCAWLALAVTFVRLRAPDSSMNRWIWLAVVFCLLRAFDFVVQRALDGDLGQLVWLLDFAVLAILLALVLGTSAVRDALTRQQQEAAHAEAEYGRALLDYTQLVRHRIANPLTAVIVGLDTLIRLDPEERLRKQILHATIDSARKLERVALHPEQVSSEERSLEPRPAPLDDRHARASLKAEAGQVESDFRDVNRQLIDVLPDTYDHGINFICECSARDCSTPITLTLRQYYDLHADGAQFVVAPEHNLPAVEDVVHQEDGWWVVRKRGKPARDARVRNDATA